MPRESASQAGPSRGRDEAEDAAARRARRQKRREEEAYHVKGWENLYGGGGSKPVFAHDPLPSSKTPRQGQSSSQSPTKSTRDPASSRRRTQSPAKTSNTSSASSSKLPPSTAPPTTRSMTPHASTPRLTKRKASTPSLYTSPNKKSKAAAAAAPTTRRQTAQDSDDSDDDFEITGACGPAATRFSSNVAPASSIKVSPSAVSPLNARRSSSSRRSVSKAPSAGVQSPAAPSLPAQDDGDTLSSASAPASRGASQTRASASSSSRSTPGPAKLTAEEIEALKDNALREYEQGVSLAQHIDNSVRDFTAGLSADHPDLPIVSQFQRKVADLGAQLTIKELRIDIPTLPPRFQKRFAPAVAAYVKYLKREGAQTQGDAVPDNVATSSVRSPDPAQQQAPDKGNSTATLNNDVGHDSAVESVGSPQAFGTPPEQPLDDLDEAATTHPSPPRAASTPTVSKAQEPAEELESNAEEQEARAGSAIPQEADEPEEENELIDELEDDDREGIKSGEQRRSAPAKSSELSTDDPTAEADVEALVTGSADSSSRADAAVAHPPSDKQNLLQTGDANETAPDSRIEGIHQQITQEASDVAERLEHRPTEGSGEEMAPPASNSPPGEGNDGALVTAADQIEGAAAAGGIIQSFTAIQQPAADLDGKK
ncbi:hypothetical protein PHBOTO_006188 [Pseudozyma hubeiensis]|nr:hypothetical protein PHBOTO_006188 [Pseudozyma hubeiensis]